MDFNSNTIQIAINCVITSYTATYQCVLVDHPPFLDIYQYSHPLSVALQNSIFFLLESSTPNTFFGHNCFQYAASCALTPLGGSNVICMLRIYTNFVDCVGLHIVVVVIHSWFLC
eukprot:724571_1